jgi:hypothetical protein
MKDSFRWVSLFLVAAATPVAAFPIDSNNIYEHDAEVQVGATDYGSTVIATCNDGDVVVSGGCYTHGFAHLVQSARFYNGWRCDYDNTAFGITQDPPISLILSVIPGTRGAQVYCAHP